MRIKDYNCKYFGYSDNLSLFLSDMRKYTVPTAEEENELIISYKNGNEDAGKELICRHLRFLYSLAKIYARNEDEVIDYVNEGAIGFKAALDKFNPELGYKFITYSVWYVLRSMNYYFNVTKNMVNRANNTKIGNKADVVKQKYYSEYGREPSNEEVIEIIKNEYGIEIKDESDIYDVNISSINEEIDDDYTVEDNQEYNNKTSSINEYEEESEREYRNSLLRAAFSQIPAKHADILKMLFGIGYDRVHTVQEVSEKYRISQSAVIELRDKTIQYLRQNVERIRVLAK